MITVVIVNYNDYETTAKYIHNIEKYEVIEHIIVVDNCSTDCSFACLTKLGNKKIDIIRSDKNGGYGYGNNFGMRYAHTKYGSQFILVSNPDVSYEEAVLHALEERMLKSDDVAVVAATMKNPDGAVSPIASWKIPGGWSLIFGTFAPYIYFVKGYHNKRIDEAVSEMNVDAVSGSMLLVRYSALEAVGFYDEDIFLYMEETTLGIKLKRAKMKTVVLNQVFFTHFHSVSIDKSIDSVLTKSIWTWDSLKIVLRKYYGFSEMQMRTVEALQRFSLFYCKIRLRMKERA